MTLSSSFIVPLVIACAAGIAHAKSPLELGDSSADGAHVSISAGEHAASLQIVPAGDSEPIAECESYCDFWALPGRYTLYTRDHETGVRHELGFRVKRSVRYALHEGDDTARDAGLALGITGSAAVVVGFFMTIPVVLSAMCEDSNCVTDSERRTANIGLGLMAGGAIATPLGFTLFAQNRTTLKRVVDAYASGGPSLRVGVVGVSGGLGLGGLAVF